MRLALLLRLKPMKNSEEKMLEIIETGAWFPKKKGDIGKALDSRSK
jgi:hypothetical protein